MVAARLHRALPRWRREASGTRFPNQGSRSGRSVRERRELLQSCARPPSCPPSRPPARWSRGRLCSCHKCQVLSPVGAPKLLLRTAGPQRRAAPRVPPDPRVPASPPPALPCPAGTTTPVPLSVLGGPATCFSGRPGGAYGNSWRELNADVGGLWSCVFCLIWGGAAGVPGTLRAGQRTQPGAANVTTRGGGVSAGSLDAGPEGGGRRGQEFGVRRGRTSPATYYSVCNLLLGLSPLPPAPQCFLNYNFFF